LRRLPSIFLLCSLPGHGHCIFSNKPPPHLQICAMSLWARSCVPGAGHGLGEWKGHVCVWSLRSSSCLCVFLPYLGLICIGKEG
jgi:hypothetical protein